MGPGHFANEGWERVSASPFSHFSFKEKERHVDKWRNIREYVKITHTYPLTFARALAQTTAPKPINFIYVSGEGATTSPGRFTPIFGVTKGRAEADLLALSKDPALGNLRPFSVRPGGVDPSAHGEIDGFVPQKKGIERVFQSVLLPGIKAVMPSMLSPTRDLGRYLSELAMGDGGALSGVGVEGEGRTVTNAGFRRLAGL